MIHKLSPDFLALAVALCTLLFLLLPAYAEEQPDLLARGNELSLQGKWSEALELYTESLSANPTATAFERRAAARYQLKQYQEAVEDFGQAIKLEPTAERYVGRARAYLNLAQARKSSEDCAEALELDGESVSAHCTRADAYILLKEYNQAMKDADAALAADTNCARGYRVRGWARFHLKHFQQAIDDFNTAVQMDSGDSFTYVCRGFAYLAVKSADQAVADFRQASAIRKNESDYDLLGLSLAYKTMGKTSLSREYDSKLKEHPDYLTDVNELTKLSHLLCSAESPSSSRSSAHSTIGRQFDRGQAHRSSASNGSGKFLSFLGRTAGIAAAGYFGGAPAAGALMRAMAASDAAQSSSRSIAAMQQAQAASQLAPMVAEPRSIRLRQQPGAGAELERKTYLAAPSATEPVETTPFKFASRRPAEQKANLEQHNNKNADLPIGDKWALVIGVSKFANNKHNLKYAAKDAQDFYDYLITEGNFKKDHVLLLLNENATRRNIMAAFGDKFLPAVVRDGDLVAVYVSTHGTPASQDPGKRNFIVAYDTEDDALYETGVDMDELYRRVKDGVRTDRALIVMDTCYSGAGVPGARGIDYCANFDATQAAQGFGHLVMSSSAPTERSWESKVSTNGVFTKYLLQDLRLTKGNVKNAFSKLKDDVAWETQNAYNQPQHPQLGGNWEGKELVLSATPHAPRAILNPDLVKLLNLRNKEGSPLKTNH